MTSGWPTAADLLALREATPTYTLTDVAPVDPARALALWADPETARRTNPLFAGFTVQRQESTAEGERLEFTVSERIPLPSADAECFSIPITFAAVLWTPHTEASGKDSTAAATLFSFAPAACNVRVVNRWTFRAASDPQTTAVVQDTFITAPSCLHAFTVSTARRGQEQGLRNNIALLTAARQSN